MEQLFVSSSTEETQDIASTLISELEKGTTICLYGNLAAGKTTFTQGIAYSLGISRLVSPTFIIMREYPVTSHPVIKRLYHMDLYRLNSIDEIKAFDADEIWSDPSNLLVIEWPEKFTDVLPKNRIDIHFKATSENERQIQIDNKG